MKSYHVLSNKDMESWERVWKVLLCLSYSYNRIANSDTINEKAVNTLAMDTARLAMSTVMLGLAKDVDRVLNTFEDILPHMYDNMN